MPEGELTLSVLSLKLLWSHSVRLFFICSLSDDLQMVIKLISSQLQSNFSSIFTQCHLTLRWSSDQLQINFSVISTQCQLTLWWSSDDLLSDFWLNTDYFQLIWHSVSAHSLSDDLQMIVILISGGKQITFSSISTQCQLTLWWSSDDLLSDFCLNTDYFQLNCHSVSAHSPMIFRWSFNWLLVNYKLISAQLPLSVSFLSDDLLMHCWVISC